MIRKTELSLDAWLKFFDDNSVDPTKMYNNHKSRYNVPVIICYNYNYNLHLVVNMSFIGPNCNLITTKVACKIKNCKIIMDQPILQSLIIKLYLKCNLNNYLVS